MNSKKFLKNTAISVKIYIAGYYRPLIPVFIRTSCILSTPESTPSRILCKQPFLCNTIFYPINKRLIYRFTSFRTRVFTNGVSQFCRYVFFDMKYYFNQFLHILRFFKSLNSKSTQMLLDPKKETLQFVQPRYVDYSYGRLDQCIFICDVFGLLKNQFL